MTPAAKGAKPKSKAQTALQLKYVATAAPLEVRRNVHGYGLKTGSRGRWWVAQTKGHAIQVGMHTFHVRFGLRFVDWSMWLSCVALLFQDPEAEKPEDAELVPKAPKAKKTKKAIGWFGG